jgi:stress response protein YsnF
MVLYKLEDFDTNYQDAFDGNDIKGYEVYSDLDNEKVGTVKNILVEESGRFRYLVVDTGFWIFGKQVLLPVGRIRIDTGDRRVYAVGFTKEQAEALPEFSDDLKVDYDYEEVRGVYRDRADTATPLETSAASMPYVAGAAYDRNTYNYEQEPDLYNMGDRNQDTLKLYEERLVANKTRRKAGEVSIGKHVEATFREGEVAHVDLYEEKPDIRKEAVLREEVRIRKEVEQEMVSTQEQVRREELDIDSEGRPIVDKDR